MTKQKLSVLLQIGDLGLRRKVQEVLQTFRDLSVTEWTPRSRADLLIYELGSGSDPDKDFQAIQELLESDAVGEVFLISSTADQNILLRSIRVGVREFLTLPLQEEELKRALESFSAKKDQSSGNSAQAREKKMFTVMGSKGGAGTTSIAVNLASALAAGKSDRSVLLVDMNLNLGEIPLHLNFKHQYNWGDLAQNIKRMDATFLHNVLFRHETGLAVLPGPEYVNGNASEFQEILDRMLTLLRESFDVVVIDAGHSLHGLIQQCLRRSDNVLVVSQLSLPYLATTSKLLSNLRRILSTPEEQLQVIINRYVKKTDLSLQEAEESLKAGIFWSVPNDYKFALSAINQGKTFFQADPRHKLTQNFRDLANKLAPAAPEAKDRKRRWLFR